ncbi:MAG TPA: ATP-binding protein [Desulfobacterales bacterium]|nr:MAG: hypothetical protein DRH50_12530 [Deltaproteobacteria bacterium]HDG98396.1 ATP-binding protein [Desulfobacterales bacterium]
MIPKTFHEITAADILSLFENRVAEGRTLEYKKELPHEGESKKIPFLAEVSAFANTSGGDLVFGVSEENGFIRSIDGVKVENPDKEILRLDNAIRNGIDPRLPSVHIRAVPLNSGAFIFVVRVSRSWNAPHRVVFNDHSKFYGRSSAGKYPLDVTELRSAFLLSERLSEKIRAFRNERAISLLTETTQTVNLKKGGKLLLHLLPLSAFTGTSANLIAPRTELSGLFPPLGEGGWSHKLNIDGFVTYSEDQERNSVRYCQLFRSGIIEAVIVLTPWDKGELVLASPWYEQEILKATKRYLAGLSKFSIEAPLYLALSLVDMKGYRLGFGQVFFRSDGDTLDRELVLLPEVVIDDFRADIPEALHPIFDMVSNAFGYEQSYNYDQNGKWRGTP